LFQLSGLNEYESGTLLERTSADQLTMKKKDVLFPHNFNADPDPLYAAPAPEPDPTP
jgi:hypothetical protein